MQLNEIMKYKKKDYKDMQNKSIFIFKAKYKHNLQN